MAMNATDSGDLEQPASGTEKPVPRFPAVLFALCISALLGLAITTFQLVKNHENDQARSNLAAVADLKQKQIADWLNVLKRNFDGIATDALLSYVVEPWLAAGRPPGEDEARISDRLTALRNIFQLKSIQLFSPDGREIALAGIDYPPPGGHEFQRALQTPSGLVTDIHLGERADSQDTHIDVIGALRVKHAGTSAVVAVMVFHVGLSDSLFPLLQHWPTPSETAETLLVRRERDDVVYLNDVRHRRNHPVERRLPLSDRTAEARAVLGEVGLIEAIDYRGQPVLAELHPVAGTTWYLVAKQDLAEIYAPIKRAGWIAGSATFCLAGLLGLLLWFWHGRRVAFHAIRAAQAEARFGSLLRQANDIILLMDEHGTVLDANPHAIDTLGYPRDQLIGMNVGLAAGPALPSTGLAQIFGRCNGAAEFIGESLLRRADGRLFPAETKCKLVESRGKRYYQAIIRDIGERKAAEQKIQRLNDFYAALHQTSLAMVRTMESTALFAEICRIAFDYAHVSLAVVIGMDTQTGKPLLFACAGADPQDIARELSKLEIKSGEEPGLAGRCFRDRVSSVCQDIENDQRLPVWRNLWDKFRLRSGAALPLWQGNRVPYVLGLYSEETQFWDNALLKLLETMAGDISFALDRLDVDARHERSLQELKDRELLFRTVADFTADWEMWIGPDRRYRYISPSCETLTGYPRSAFLDDPGFLHGILHPDDRQGFKEHERIFDTPRADDETTLEFRVLHKEGQIVWIEHTCRAVFDDAGCYAGRRISNRNVTERKAREAELAKREALYRGVVESQLDGFWLVDRYGRLQEVNEAYVKRSGYRREELLSMRISDLEAVETAQDIAARIEKVIDVGSDLFETMHRTKDGTNWLAEVSAQYLPREGGILCIFIRDIRQRKRAESLWQIRLKLSEIAQTGTLDELMQASLDAAERFTGSSIGFFHFVDQNQEDLILQAWSTNTLREMCKAEGKGAHYPVSEAGIWVECFHRRAPVIHNDYASLTNKKGLPEGHAPVVRELTVPVIRQGLVVSILGVGNKATDYEQSDVDLVKDLAELAMDLVAEKQAEQALRESEELYRRIVTSANEGIWWLDEQDHTVFVNQALSAMLGYSEKEIVGPPAESFMFEEDLAVTGSTWNGAIPATTTVMNNGSAAGTARSVGAGFR